MFGADRILEAANYDFKGKSVLITGASGGIGLAIIKKLLESGATVYSNSRRELEINHENLYHSTGDITDDEYVKSWVAEIGNIDGFVYGAGIVDIRPIRFENKEIMKKVWDANYFSAVFLAGELIKKKKFNDHSSSVFISSISVLAPHIGGGKYTASKSALQTFSKVMMLELSRKKARANCIAPAMVDTDIYRKGIETNSSVQMDEHISKYPLGIGLPADVAQMTCFLLSDASRWINSTTIRMDGGYLLT